MTRYTTKFIDTTPDLFDVQKAPRSRDEDPDLYRRYHRQRSPRSAQAARKPAGRCCEPPCPPKSRMNRRRRHGTQFARSTKAHKRWQIGCRPRQQVLITDTTMRDGHQSLLATRMRSVDMIAVAPAYAAGLPQPVFSVECWGRRDLRCGSMRFLQRMTRGSACASCARALPNIMTQMLLRGANGVGYTNYPDNVVQFFVRQAAADGRGCVPRVRQPQLGREHARRDGCGAWTRTRCCEGTICYTGDLHDPARSKYDLQVLCRDGQGAEGGRRRISWASRTWPGC